MQKKWLEDWWKPLTRGALALAVLVVASGATATTIEFKLTPFTGDPTGEVTISLDDAVVPGAIEVTATISGSIGDLRGIFFNIADDDLLGDLEVTGVDVTDVEFEDLIDLGRGSNLHGGGSPCPCDVGVELGTPGIGMDDLQTVVFLIAHESMDLDLSLFANQEFGARVTSVGPNREGSVKLSGLSVVPEPGTALLLTLGLTGLAVRRSSR